MRKTTTTKTADKRKAAEGRAARAALDAMQAGAPLAGDGQVIAPINSHTSKAKAAKAAKELAAIKVRAAGKAPKAKPLSPTAAIRALLAADPTLEADALEAALAKRGMQPPRSSIKTVRADFLGCLRALQAAGRLKLN